MYLSPGLWYAMLKTLKTCPLCVAHIRVNVLIHPQPFNTGIDCLCWGKTLDLHFCLFCTIWKHNLTFTLCPNFPLEQVHSLAFHFLFNVNLHIMMIIMSTVWKWPMRLHTWIRFILSLVLLYVSRSLNSQLILPKWPDIKTSKPNLIHKQHPFMMLLFHPPSHIITPFSLHPFGFGYCTFKYDACR